MNKTRDWRLILVWRSYCKLTGYFYLETSSSLTRSVFVNKPRDWRLTLVGRRYCKLMRDFHLEKSQLCKSTTFTPLICVNLSFGYYCIYKFIWCLAFSNKLTFFYGLRKNDMAKIRRILSSVDSRREYIDGKTPYVFFNYTGNDSQMFKLHH